MATLAPQGVDNPNFSKTALAGQAGSLDPTLGANPGGQTNTGNAYTLSSTPAAGGRSLYTPASGTDLSNSLENSFETSNPYQSILSTYHDATGATGAQYAAAGGEIANQYGQDIGFQGQENRLQLDNSMTGRGLATNTALLADQQDQADHRIKLIHDQMNAALASNNTAAAAKLADLATSEQTAITNARTSFLDTYFKTQEESRAQATFQTPEQQSVLALAGQYPNAGITPADSLASAQSKVTGSAQYKLTQASTQASVTNALAQASAAGASAAQTREITSLMTNAPDQNGDVTALLNHSITPEQLKAKYGDYPGGVGGAIAANIISAAQSQGYNVNTGTLQAEGQKSQTEALNSGNPLNVFGGLTSQAAGGLINAFSGAPRTYSSLNAPQKNFSTLSPSVNYSSPTTGATSNVNGTTYVFDGKNWVKKK